MSKASKKSPALSGGEVSGGEKLQKVLARAGLGSRREMERWIEHGRVAIEGKAAQVGDRVYRGQRIEVDGKALAADEAAATRCLLYHKPGGEVCSRRDPDGRRTVFERLPKLKAGRWVSVGRLDYTTSGLLIFTTDGELANGLMHPRAQIEREYLVRVRGEVSDDMLKTLLRGVVLDDGPARFTDIQPGGGDGLNRWFYVVLMEGRNREVRRLWESQGLTVSRLKRVRYGNLFIPSKVKQGQWLELDAGEVATLYRMAGLPAQAVAGLKPAARRRQERRHAQSGRVRGAGSDGSSTRKPGKFGNASKQSSKPGNLTLAESSKPGKKSKKARDHHSAKSGAGARKSRRSS